MSQLVTFWFECASTYSYLSVMRIEEEAKRRCVDVEWKPFLLGPIFQAQGWNTSPIVIYPAKGQNNRREIERRAQKHGVPFLRPEPDDPRVFPQNSLLAARTAIAALHKPWGKDFVKRVYEAQCADGLDISDPAMIGHCIESAGGASRVNLQMGHSNTQKALLRENTDAAIAAGIFGAPSFTVRDELFWGDDRLEDALDWAA